ncbi:MAG: SDR family oxidoreductase [Alphaproteobacteria bacterium]
MKTAVVTGVSSGIGRAVARELVKRKFRVFGSVRKEADGQALRAELGEAFTPLIFDITDAGAVTEARDRVADVLGDDTLTGLVNNAGIAVPGPLLHLPPDEFRHQLEVNTVSILSVTQVFAPLLGARRPMPARPGRIVNISSVGGRMVSPFLGAYAASKHALEAISDAFRRELMIYGIDVVVVEPGAVATAIWDKAEEEDRSIYADTIYGPVLEKFSDWFIARGRAGFPPEKIARTVHRALTVSKPRARYLLVPQRLTNWTLPRLMGDRLLDRAMAARLGLKRKN